MFGIVGVVECVEGGTGLLVDGIAIVGRGFIGCHCFCCFNERWAMSISCDDDEYRNCLDQALGGWYLQ